MTDTHCTITGQLSRRRLWRPLYVIYSVTGISLLFGLWTLFARYLLQLRTSAVVVLSDDILTISTTRRLFGKELKTSRTIIPTNRIFSIQMENRSRTIHLLIGFGFLTAGLFCGIHWLLDGLGAGYPSLFLLGAGIIVAGIAIDMVLFLLIPGGQGRSSVVVNTAAWRFRLTGTQAQEAVRFVESAAVQLSLHSANGADPNAISNESSAE